MTDEVGGSDAVGRRRRHRRVTRPATGGTDRRTGSAGLAGGAGVDQTLDDTDAGWGETPESGDARDRWYVEQRPPHWG